MHCIALRRTLADAHPWLPKVLFDAFSAAKQSAMDDLQKINFLRISLPWVAAHFEETSRLLGDDYWAYGFERNRQEVEAMLRYARADGLLTASISARDLFHESVLQS
jgi:4,5-dihydroxyphthalate decarboxylase